MYRCDFFGAIRYCVLVGGSSVQEYRYEHACRTTDHMVFDTHLSSWTDKMLVSYPAAVGGSR
jgi:hypothetical protein